VGGVTAVAVFDHRPAARELLERRLERGWRPTASRLQGGERVTGYAACVFDEPWLRAKARGAAGET
jgi:hypothetical protein